MCEEKYLREEDLLTQVRTIVEKLSLPDEWSDDMLKHLDQENSNNESTRQGEMRCFAAKKEALGGKLDALIDLKLNGALETDEYPFKKNSLLNQKADTEQKCSKAMGCTFFGG